MSQQPDNNTSLEIFPNNRTIKFWDPSFDLTDDTAISDPVPSDYDIFNLLNIQKPPDVSARNWTLVFANGSLWEPRIHRMYKVNGFLPFLDNTMNLKLLVTVAAKSKCLAMKRFM